MGLKKSIEDLFAAATFAEEGEFETARQLEARHTVLLVLGGHEPDGSSLKYALNFAKRTGAVLEVLYVAREERIRAMLAVAEDEAGREGVELKVVKRDGCIRKEVVGYTEKRRDIQLVVVRSVEDLDEDCSERELLRSWKNLECPLAVVSGA